MKVKNILKSYTRKLVNETLLKCGSLLKPDVLLRYSSFDTSLD